VGGIPVLKPWAQVARDARIALSGGSPLFVSRGGEKLDGALARFGLTVAGRGWLDAGASTGGFTDRLLQGGAARVAAVDVGYGQLAWSLRNDPRVVVLERTNVRHLTRASIPFAVEGVVADLSFISLRLVLPALVATAQAHADLVLLVKPQFELGRAEIGRGVVRDPALWKRALNGVVEAAAAHSYAPVDAVAASPPGPAGNREFFLWLRRDQGLPEAVVERAIEELEG
jgi:23S rRNA (cytidine1920-2'-O)/16S rRNA (cytidine1409-2'-O)-methyltransferase